MSQPVRHIEPVIRFENSIVGDLFDVSRDIAPHLASLTYEDVEHGEADTLELRLQNADGRWLGPWLPEEGARIEALLLCHHWYLPNQTVERDLGLFSVAAVDIESPPSVVSIRCLSADVTQAMRREKRTHQWEGASLERIAHDVATRNGLGLLYEGPTVTLKRADQHLQPDLQFVRSVMEPYDLSVKVAKGQLIITTPQSLAETVVAQVERQLDGDQPGQHGYSRCRLRRRTHRAFRSCRVTFYDTESEEKRTYTAIAENTESGEILIENISAESQADAKAKAEARLRRANRALQGGELDFPGRPEMTAGVGIDLAGFDAFDGRYLVTRSRHAWSQQGYTTSISFEVVA